MKQSIFFLFCCFFLSIGLQAQHTSSLLSRQIWAEPSANAEVALTDALNALPVGYVAEKLPQLSDRAGLQHFRYQLTYAGYELTGQQILIVEKRRGGFQAAYPRHLPQPTKLRVEIEESEWREQLNSQLKESDFKFTSHRYAFVPFNLNFDQPVFQLAAVIELEIPGSHRHDRLYLSAATGHELARHPIDCSFVPGTAETYHYGEQTIETTLDENTGMYSLFDQTRGDGINTIGVDGDIFDEDNDWSYEDNSLTMALDVHYGLGITYDFFNDRYSRNSLDGNGVLLRAATGQAFANAFYGGPQDMAFGAGEPGDIDLPLSSVDIVGHEMAHGYTAFSSDLIYAGESGGLNEAFSDIAGVTVEWAFYPVEGVDAWTLGEGASSTGFFIRNMSDPNVKQMPDTYEGDFWQPNLEVHSGSSIANFWFFLLVEGQAGTNDVGYEYDVDSIGYLNAMDIVYDTWTNRLSESSNYADCAAATVLSATDLFGECSAEVLAVQEAWRAVNVLSALEGTLAFDITRTCDPDVPITFTAEVPGELVEWIFGDGTTSTDNPATHIYLTDGVYTPTLRMIDNCTGDTITHSNMDEIIVSVADNAVCSFEEFSSQTQTLVKCSGQITDDGGIDDEYSNNFTGEIILNEGTASAYQLDFEQFEVEAFYDNLFIYEGENPEPSYSFTGGFALPPETLIVNGSTVRLVFESDGSVTDGGFLIVFNCIIPTAAPEVSVASLAEYEECRGLRSYAATSTNFPNTYSWEIEGEEVGTDPAVTIDWATYPEGSYILSMEACNNVGCDTVEFGPIVVGPETGDCELVPLDPDGEIAIFSCVGGLVDDGGVEGPYSDNVSSYIDLLNEDGLHYELNFLELDLEFSYDFLTIYDIASGTPEELATYTGFNEPFIRTFETSQLRVVFESDVSITTAGFQIEYSCVSPSSSRDLSIGFDWEVYPNPFNNELFVSGLPIRANWQLRLLNATGQQLGQWSFDNGATDNLNLRTEASLSAGFYLIEATSDQGERLLKRIVKQ